MDSPKGTRKDTPAHVQMPSNLCYEMQKVSLRPSIEDDDLQESSENIIEKNYQTAKTAKETNSNSGRSRKPTPAHIQNYCASKKKKNVSFDEDIVEQDEEEKEDDVFQELQQIKSVENTSKVYRKDTPASNRIAQKAPTKARSLCSEDSITEEDENENDSDDTMTSYRLRKQSILLCSHPSLEK